MREIKFRAWFPEDHWYHQGMLYGWENTTGIESLCFVPDVKSGIKIMQFSGLSDEEGKELYEGDLVIDSSLMMRPIETILQIEFIKGSFDGVEPDTGNRIELAELEDNCKVIGNIHQHPELMEVSG